jgi:hypothetical protein
LISCDSTGFPTLSFYNNNVKSAFNLKSGTPRPGFILDRIRRLLSVKTHVAGDEGEKDRFVDNLIYNVVGNE